MIDSSSRDTLLRVGWALIEALPLAAVAVTVTATLPAGAPRLTTAPLVLLVIAATLTGRAATRLPARPPLGRALALPVAALLAFGWLRLSVPSGAGAVASASLSLLALGGVGRGLLLGFQQPAHAALMRAFLRGAVALTLLFALLSLARVSVEASLRAQLRLMVLGYFAVGPAVVAVAQQRDLGRARGKRTPLTASWLMAVLLPVASALAIAVLASAGSGGMRSALGAAMHVAGLAVDLTARAAAWVAYAGVFALTWLARALPGGGSRHAPPPLPPSAHEDDAPPIAVGPPVPLTVAQHDVAAAMLLVTAVLFATLYVSKLLRAPAAADDPFDADEERTSLWSWKLFARQARDLVRALLSHGRTLSQGAAARSGWRTRPARDADLSDVRGVYRALLRWAARRGRPRAPATTPHELAAQVACDDGERAHLDAITQLYAEARYGERTTTPASLAAARAHLDALSAPAPAARPEDPPERR